MPSDAYGGPAAPIKVLLADDDPGVRNMLWMSLRMKGYRVASVPDGRMALELFRKELPDVIVTDMEMPVMGGEELCRRLQEEDPLFRTPVVLMSGKHIQTAHECANRLPLVAVLPKPFSVETLEEVMGRLVRGVAAG